MTKKCDQCSATIMFGARTFADHTFCSLKCIVLAKRAGLRDHSMPVPPKPPLRLVVPTLAAAHALIPLYLLATRSLDRSLGPTTYVAVALFWSWPLWLWPLIYYRARSRQSTVAALVVSLLALGVAALPMLSLTVWNVLGMRT